VTVELALSVVVETPVAPVIAPELDISIDGVERKLVNPVAEEKLIPLITLELLFVAAGKLMPFSIFVLLVLVAFERVRLTPLVVMDDADVLALVRSREASESLLVEVEYVSANFPDDNVRFPDVIVSLPDCMVRSLPVVTVVAPFNDILPVPVENVPLPEIAKLPDDCE
jgi:hypothetical protein